MSGPIMGSDVLPDEGSIPGRGNHPPPGGAAPPPGGYAGTYPRGGYGGPGNSGRDRRPPSGRGAGQRDGDWVCPDTSCGNVNFARRAECNKCGAARPPGSGQPPSGGYGAAASYDSQSGGYGGGKSYGAQGGSTGYGAASNYPRQGVPGVNGAPNDYGSYGAAANHGPEGQGTGGGKMYGGQTGGGNGGGGGYGSQGGNAYGNNRGFSGGRGGTGGFESNAADKGLGYADARVDYGRDEGWQSGQQGGSDAPKVKQCDETCDDSCDNSRIYISGLPLDTTIDELKDLFGGIGQVARIKQKRGYKDQWPYNIKLYRDDQGKIKGDGVLSYEDPSAAHSAGGFFNNYSFRGHNIKVTMAEKSAPRAPTGGGYGQGYGGDRGGGYGDRGYNSGGPDRRFGGGHRSRPY